MKKKNDQNPVARSANMVTEFFDQIRLAWALLMDNRVPIVLKLIPLGAIAYTISPIDFILDIIPVLGQLDDLGILLTALSVFNSMAPADVVAEHTARIKDSVRRPEVIDVHATKDKSDYGSEDKSSTHA